MRYLLTVYGDESGGRSLPEAEIRQLLTDSTKRRQR